MDYPITTNPSAPPSVAFNIASPLSLTRFPNPIPVWYVVHLEFYPTCHLPASATRLCAPRRVPDSAALSRVHSPPLTALGLCPGPCWSLEGRPMLVPPYPLCPRLSHSPCESLYPVIFWCLVSFSSRGLFSVQRKESQDPPLPGSFSPRYLETPTPFSPPPSAPPTPSLHIVLIPSLCLKFVGCSTSCHVQIQHSLKRLIGLLNRGPDHYIIWGGMFFSHLSQKGSVFLVYCSILLKVDHFMWYKIYDYTQVRNSTYYVCYLRQY